jgi:acyl-coenzyme A thioesterase PaaI-like protein
LSSRSAEPAPFYTRYGLQRTGERESPLRLAPYPPIGRNGSLRATIVAAAVDIVGSLYTREQAGSDILYTTDLSVRLPHAGMPSLLRTHARSLRSGRSGSTTAVELFASETLWAYGETSFARQPRPGDASPPRSASPNPDSARPSGSPSSTSGISRRRRSGPSVRGPASSATPRRA